MGSAAATKQSGSNSKITSGDIEITSGRQTGAIEMTNSGSTAITVTFSGNSSLNADITRDGNISSGSAKDVTVKFTNGTTMTGNINTGVMKEGNDFSSNIVTFSGASNVQDIVLTGNIYSGGARSFNDGNHVTFTNGSMRGDIIAEIKYYGGYNSVTFSQDDAKLEGNINSYGAPARGGGGGGNIVKFTVDGIITGRVYSAMGNNTVTIGGNATITNGVQTSTDGYSSYNSVTISGNGVSTIGDVLVTGNYATNSKNIIQAANASKLVLNTLKADSGKNLGDQTQSGNINQITVKGTLQVNSGGIHSIGSGNNIINAETLVLGNGGGITAENGGFSGYNTITLSGTNGLSIGAVSVNGNQNTNSKNTIAIEQMAAGQSLTIASLSANNGKVTGDAKTSGNINEIKLGKGTLQVNSGGIHSIGSGNNIINAETLVLGNGGGITAENGGFSGYNTITLSGTNGLSIGAVSVNGNQNTNSKNTIAIEQMAAGQSLTIASLSANNGKVTGDAKTSGNINEIKLGKGTLEIKSGGVYASNGGNNIITAAKLVLADNGNITIGNDGYSSYNTITLTGADTVTTVGAISASGNHNTNSVNTLKVTNNLYILNSITANNGSKDSNKLGNQNIINVDGVLAINLSQLDDVQLPAPGPVDLVPEGRETGIKSDEEVVAIFADKGTNTINAKGNALILGDIKATNSGTNNLYIKDSNAQIPNGVQNPNMIGRVVSSGGSNNIIFDGGFWMPEGVTGVDGGDANHPAYAINGSGEIVTSGGGSTTMIFRQGVSNPLDTDIAQFKIDHSGSGETNIVMQSNTTAQHINTQMFLNYGKQGVINTIFAATNSGTDSNQESFSNGTNSANATFFGVTYKTGVQFTIYDQTVGIGNENKSLVDTYGSLYRLSDGTLLSLISKRDTAGTDTVVVQGLAVGAIKALESSNVAWNYNVTLDSGSAFAGSIALQDQANIQLTMNYDTTENMGSKFIVVDDSTKLKALNIDAGVVDTTQLQLETLAQTNTVINLATGGAAAINTLTRTNFRLLEIGDSANKTTGTGLLGNGGAVFVNYVNANAAQDVDTTTIAGISINGTGQHAYADRIVVHNIGDNTSKSTAQFYMQLAVDANTKLSSIKYTEGGTATEGNIAVATIAKVNTTPSAAGVDASAGAGVAGASLRAATDDAAIRNMGVISIQEADVMQGFDQIHGTLKAVETKADGTIDSTTATNNTYVTYFVNSIETKGATEATQGVSASALATNYDLYIANFNSLNKRMGELRDNDNSQGAWIRIFNGSQTNDFGLGTTTSYTTFQGGYDYAFGMEGANNYLGVAVAYGMSTSKTNSNAFNAISGNIEGIKDIKSNLVEVALYNSYVQDSGWYNDTIFKFSYIMSDFTMMLGSDAQSTSNMAYTFSDEFGYRFKLGSENEWYIDPQAELSFGYFDQTDFVQKLGRATLNSQAVSLMTLRSRLGSSFGYDFKKFTADKPIKASVYVGAFYEYDYVTGGDVTLTTNLGGESSTSGTTASDGRVVMNVGTNMTIKDNTRIYFDFEKSFGGSITTDYQVNLGVRYSFGESNGYTPAVAKAKEVAPLKVEEVKNTQENQAQESKTTQESK